jgi:hypothetical protein
MMAYPSALSARAHSAHTTGCPILPAPSSLGRHPRPLDERRPMADVLLMTTGQLSNPVPLLVLMVADDRTRKRIYESTIWCPDRSLRHVRRLRAFFRENVDHWFPGGDEIVSDDPSSGICV